MNFEMTREEARDLAAFIERIRSRLPGDRWHKPGIEDALGQARQRASAPDLAIAAIRAAENPVNRTPAIIGMDGPHWREASKPPKPLKVDNTERCSICSEPNERCRARWADDHDFLSAAEAAKTKAGADPESVRHVVDLLKAEVVETPERDTAPAKTLDDIADRDPKLKANVDRVRQQIPNARMQEDEPEEAA